MNLTAYAVLLPVCWARQEILAGWLLRDVSRTRLEPALRQLETHPQVVTSTAAAGAQSSDFRENGEEEFQEAIDRNTGDETDLAIDATVVDALLRWARVDVRALHYGVKLGLKAETAA